MYSFTESRMKYRQLNVYHVCFFFQAEDGIRDLTVTGVQTCALPICDAQAQHDLAAALQAQGRPEEAIARYKKAIDLMPSFASAYYKLGNTLAGVGRYDEIGRASCRERV